MKNITLILIALLLFGGVAFGSELGILQAEHATIDGVVDDLLEIQNSPYLGKNFVRVETDLSNATWNTAASQEVFDVTGHVEYWITCYDSSAGAVTSTGATDSLFFRVGSNKVFAVETDQILANLFVTVGVTEATDLDHLTDALWHEFAPSAHGTMIHGYSNGTDIGYELDGAATGGILVWKLWYRELDTNGTVVAGAGGAL